MANGCNGILNHLFDFSTLQWRDPTDMPGRTAALMHTSVQNVDRSPFF